MKRYLLFSLLLFLFPINVFAHGTEEEHAAETVTNYWTYGIYVSLILHVAFLILSYWMKRKAGVVDQKNKKNREINREFKKKSKTFFYLALVTLIPLIVSSMMSNQNQVETGTAIEFTHIHGLGYTSDGSQIYVPAHDGFRIYENGEWKIPETGEMNDYMGFSMVKDGFYSSGHPGHGSTLANPLGIVKSTDMGQTFEKLDLYKEIDFHGMTVGYQTNDIYVYNPEKNSRMDDAGFYYSNDDTNTWHKLELNGLIGQTTAFAAHPTISGFVAFGTKEGLFLSKDYGNNFTSLAINDPITSVTFDHTNKLFIGTKEGQLIRIDNVLDDSNDVSEYTIPDLNGGVITYIKQNPVNSNELVFTTNNKDIFITTDDGDTWTKVADDGVGL